MKPRVAVLVFPGTNSEHETARALSDADLDARLVHWSAGAEGLRDFEAYVLPGGFAYEDRIRAGAVAAHEPMMEAVLDAASRNKIVIGLCNGAQILLEAGLVPGDGPVRRATAAFAPNASRRFRSVLVHVKLAIDPKRSPITVGLESGEVFPAWASHAEGRLAAHHEELEQLRAGGKLAFLYCEADGTLSERAIPNGSALGCAGLVNSRGNVLALMPHPERIAWHFQLSDGSTGWQALQPGGGMRFFRSLAQGLRAQVFA